MLSVLKLEVIFFLNTSLFTELFCCSAFSECPQGLDAPSYTCNGPKPVLLLELWESLVIACVCTHRQCIACCDSCDQRAFWRWQAHIWRHMQSCHKAGRKFTVLGMLGFHCIKPPHLAFQIRKKREIPGDSPFHDMTPGERVIKEETSMAQKTNEGCT